MYLYPDCVDMEQIRGEDLSGRMQGDEWTSPGIGGRDPRDGAANKQLGEMLVNGMADAIGEKARELLESLRASGKLERGPLPGGTARE